MPILRAVGWVVAAPASRVIGCGYGAGDGCGACFAGTMAAGIPSRRPPACRIRLSLNKAMKSAWPGGRRTRGDNADRSRNGQFGGHAWGVPFQRSTIVLYWNKDAFRDAGMDPGHAPGNWADHMAAAKALSQKDKRWGVLIPGSGFTYWLLQALATQAGGTQGFRFWDTAAATVVLIMGIALPYLGLAFGIFLRRQAFRQVPQELDDAARLEGSSTAARIPPAVHAAGPAGLRCLRVGAGVVPLD